jgi:Fic family protein
MVRMTGSYMQLGDAAESYKAFLPNPLPPDPPLAFDEKDQTLFQDASLALGRLDGLSAVLPDPSHFIYPYIRKEAVLSSEIEGTQASLSDLLLFESHAQPGVPLDDVQEVSNYVAAMNHGLKRLRENFPVSLRLIREIHGVLMSKGRGSGMAPGEFRRTQNWIGGSRPGNARFVPPPPYEVQSRMGTLEKFLHNQPVRTPTLLKAALAHVQFETIHPFLDGNGRVGRLLITLIMCAEGVLAEPLLYLSVYFKKHRDEYYRLLQAVRTDGSWEDWVRFFLTGVLETSNQAVMMAKSIQILFAEDRAKIEKLGHASGSALRLFHVMQKQLVIVPSRARLQIGVSVPTINSAISRLVKLRILKEVTGKSRGQVFIYSRYSELLNLGL